MRHFTIEEANALLDQLTAVLEDLRRLHERMRESVEQVRAFESRALSNGHGDHAPALNPDNDLRAIQQEVQQRLLFLDGMGIHLKDIENGIVDFPTRMFGRDVYLCWRLGEERVSYWHDMDSGFAGRRLL